MDGMENPQQLSMAFPVFWSSVSAARCFAVSLRLSTSIHLAKIDYDVNMWILGNGFGVIL